MSEPIEMPYSEFRQAIRDLGISVGDIASILNKTRRAIERWSESGRVKDPAVIVLFKAIAILQEGPYHFSKEETVALLNRAAGKEAFLISPDTQREYTIKKLEALAEELRSGL